MGIAPEIVAVATARDASDRNRALEALSDQRSLGERILFGLLIFAVGASMVVLARVGVLDQEPLAIVALQAAILGAVALAIEVYHLRRRVKALTYLLLQRERHEP